MFLTYRNKFYGYRKIKRIFNIHKNQNMLKPIVIRTASFLLLILFSVIAPDWFIIMSIVVFVIVFPSPFEVILVGSFVDFFYGQGGGMGIFFTFYATLGLILVILSILIRPRLLIKIR